MVYAKFAVAQPLDHNGRIYQGDDGAQTHGQIRQDRTDLDLASLQAAPTPFFLQWHISTNTYFTAPLVNCKPILCKWVGKCGPCGPEDKLSGTACILRCAALYYICYYMSS